MWEDDRGVTYTERELRIMLYGMGMQYPYVVIECNNIIEYRGYTFRKSAEE